MQLIKPLAGALSALSVLALSGHPAGATTPVSGGLNAVANSTINSTTATDLQNFSWSAIPAPLSTSVLATETNGNDFITTSGSALATWASPDAGTVTFTNYGWNFSVNDPTTTFSGANLTVGRGGDDWTYTFTATQNGKIQFRRRHR